MGAGVEKKHSKTRGEADLVSGDQIKNQNSGEGGVVFGICFRKGETAG